MALLLNCEDLLYQLPTNISEGCGHTSNSQLKRYLDIAIGSASEVEYLLLFSKDIGYLNQAEYKLYDNNIVEIRKMLYTYKNTL